MIVFISFMSGIVSLVVGIFAIILALHFDKVASNASNEAELALNKINDSVIQIKTFSEKFSHDVFQLQSYLSRRQTDMSDRLVGHQENTNTYLSQQNADLLSLVIDMLHDNKIAGQKNEDPVNIDSDESIQKD